jgi:hypothetical protein
VDARSAAATASRIRGGTSGAEINEMAEGNQKGRSEGRLIHRI